MIREKQVSDSLIMEKDKLDAECGDLCQDLEEAEICINRLEKEKQVFMKSVIMLDWKFPEDWKVCLYKSKS